MIGVVELSELRKILRILPLESPELDLVLFTCEAGTLIPAEDIVEYVKMDYCKHPPEYTNWTAYAQDLLRGPFKIGDRKYYVDEYPA